MSDARLEQISMLRTCLSSPSWPLLAILASSVPAFGQAAAPEGAQFLVNTYTTGSQTYPSVATDADGDFVVVWQSSSSDGDASLTSIQGQRFAASGAPLGGQFQVNTYTPDSQAYPSVAMDEDGDFVVVWQSDGSDNGDDSSTSIQGQRYAADGTPLGGQFLVNTYTTSAQDWPSVATDAAGDFVVVWESYGSDNGDPSGRSVQGQRFASDGTPLGGQFLINADTTTLLNEPKVARDGLGDFVVVWDSLGDDVASGYDVLGRRFAANGASLGPPFVVNSYTLDQQYGPSVAVDGGGDFVVVWQSTLADNGDDSSRSIQGQRFALDGTALGDQFLVNSYTSGTQLDPEVAADGSGRFVVVWRSFGADNGDSSYWSIQGQRFTADGSPLDDQFLVNSYTPFNQILPAVAMDSEGDFVVAWRSDPAGYGDDSLHGVQGRRFSGSDLIFADGFESGDTTAWMP